MATYAFKVVLVDYDEDLFTPPDWPADMLARAGIGYVEDQQRTPQAAGQLARDADVVMVQSLRPLLNREIIAGLEKCRCIVRLGIGYDTVDVPAATERGIVVCNVPFYCVEDVPDHALALLLGAVRHIARQDAGVRAGQWDRTKARRRRAA